jgi:hypothetical protein
MQAQPLVYDPDPNEQWRSADGGRYAAVMGASGGSNFSVALIAIVVLILTWGMLVAAFVLSL